MQADVRTLVYAQDGYIALPVQFYLAEAYGEEKFAPRSSNFEVIETSDPNRWQGERFWVVAHRNAIQRYDKHPAEILRDNGYVIEQEITETTNAPGMISDDTYLIAAHRRKRQ